MGDSIEGRALPARRPVLRDVRFWFGTPGATWCIVFVSLLGLDRFVLRRFA